MEHADDINMESIAYDLRTELIPMSKLGRNDPCHCGSGKKYKRCHGLNSAPAAVATPEGPYQAAKVDKAGLADPSVNLGHMGFPGFGQAIVMELGFADPNDP